MSREKKKKIKHSKHYGRHKFLYRLLRPLGVVPFCKLKFGYKCKIAKKLPKNYIVLSNHTTDFDPLFVASSFRKQMYFVASEHLTRWGTAYKFLNYTFAPIIRYKGSVAVTTVKEILSKTKRGENVCVFAEGVRSWDGVTGDILPSTAKMVRSAGCGLVTYRIKGGYFASPNWATSKARKGRVSGQVVNIYTAEQIKAMSDEELYDIIVKDLYEDAYATQEQVMSKYKGENLAQGFENIGYICPHCKSYDTLKGVGNRIECSVCGQHMSYNTYGYLEDCQFKTIYEYSQWQKSIMKKDISKAKAYELPKATLSAIDTKHTKTQICEDKITINPEYLKCGEEEFAIQDIEEMAIYGKHGIVFASNKKYYEIKGDEGYSAWKIVNYYHMLKKKDK